mgnify:CR=1|tara:strand:+ start:167 stop:454 length:288 start_codon:yes stop_codon:yes gene_type:complete
MLELPPDFPHDPPEGYSYEVKSFKSNMDAIWLRHHYNYVYSSDTVRTIWGFYNTKKRQYIAPINAKKPGKVVSLSDTTPYTSMPINHNPLMSAFL